MYSKLLKRRLQEVEEPKEDTFTSSRYLAERMSEDMIEKARISPVKKAKVALDPDGSRKPKRPRPYIDPWGRDLVDMNKNIDYDPNRRTKVLRRGEDHTSVTMDFISEKLQSVALTEQGKDDNSCRALALYQPSPLARLTEGKQTVKATNEAVFSSISQTMADLHRTRLPALPVSDLSKAIILYPAPEETIREALKKVIASHAKSKKETDKDEIEMQCDPRIEEVDDDYELLDEEEGDGLIMSDRPPPRKTYSDDVELQVEELNEDCEMEEEEEGDGVFARTASTSRYWIEDCTDDSESYDEIQATSRGSSSSYWHGQAPPPTPLATSFSTPPPFLATNPSGIGYPSTDMNRFFSMVKGRLLNDDQEEEEEEEEEVGGAQRSASRFSPFLPAYHAVNRDGVSVVEV